MFSELFGEQAKLANAMDTYLQRMEKILQLKKLALEVNEPEFNKDMNLFVKTITNAAVEILKKSTEEEKTND